MTATRSGSARRPAKKGATKKSTAKKGAAKKSAAKKSAAKKAAAKKGSAKKAAAKKAPAKKAAARKAPARKAAAKKGSARKAAARKAPAKKAAAKKGSARKAAAKKSAARKAATRKSPTRRSGGDRGRVDPRFQARRRSIARRQGRRRLWWVAGLTLVASVAIAAIALAKSTWFDVESVQVQGAVRVDPRQVILASGVMIGDPLIEVDLDRAVAGVEAVPWVSEAQVSRHWRGGVTITVAERIGVVALPTGQRYAIADRTGRQLEVVSERPSEFVPVAGLEASGVPGQPVPGEALEVVALIDHLTPTVRGVTSQVVVDDQRQLGLDLTLGARAVFGDDRDLDQKLVALETVLTRVELACVESIDLRVADAPTVVRAGEIGREQEPGGANGGC